MMLEERAASLAADLDADEDTVREDLENLVAYSVPVEEAERSLRRKYGEDASRDEPLERTQVAAVSIDDDRVSLTATVLRAGRRPIQYDGEERVIVEGQLADSSGSIGYTAWEDFGLERGQTVNIDGAGVREWDGAPELNLGQTTTVRSVDEDLSVDVPTDDPDALVDLEPGDRDVTIEGLVVESETRTIDGRSGETLIRSGVIADETARLPMTDWEAREDLSTGATVRVENAYVREFRGVPTVNLSRFSTVDTLDREIEPASSIMAESIHDVLETGAAYDIGVTGTIVDLREGSGLIERCPECGRLTRQGRCRSHGDVDGEQDLRVKGVLDDGSATVTVILDTELTEAVYGGEVGDAVEAAREAMDQSVVTARLSDRLLGRAWQVRGQLRIDDFGGTIDARTFEPVPVEPDRAAASLLATVEGEP